MNTYLDYVIVSTDAFAIMMLTIINVTVLLEKNKVKRNTAFVGCVTMTIFSLIFEFLNYTLEGNVAHEGFLYISNYGTIVAGEGILYYFAKYAHECVNEKNKTANKMLKIVKILCFVDFVTQTIGLITGKTFVIKNAKFVAYPLYDTTFFTTAVCLTIIKIYLFKNQKYIGKYLYKVFTLYYILPVITTIILIINVNWSFLLQGVSLSLLIVYIGIEKQEKENLLIYLIDKDALTGLHNRNAWNKKTKEMRDKTDEIGIVFADLNNLKYANDQFGHLAGDVLINTFADILKTSFDERDIFRIGGDEFVIIVDKDINRIDELIKEFKSKIEDNNHIASFGMSVGKGNEINEIIRRAEANMYKDKKEYYKREEIDRRKKQKE